MSRDLDEFKLALSEVGNKAGKPIIAKFETDCGGCEQAILPGDVVLYMPKDKRVLCQSCAIDGEPSP